MELIESLKVILKTNDFLEILEFIKVGDLK